MPSRSYAEMMARPAALRKPLSYTPRSAADENAQPTVSPRRRRQLAPPPRAATSASPLANSPRRLLSYYLSKAAYNTEADEEVTEVEDGGDVEDTVDTAAIDDTDGTGDAYHDSSTACDAASLKRRATQTFQPSTSSLSLRPPPFRSAVTAPQPPATSPLPAPASFSTSLRTNSASASGDVLASQLMLEERSMRNSMLMTPPWQDNSTDMTPSVPAPPSTATAPAAAPLTSLATPAGAPSSSLSHLAVYTEGQRRAFEAQVTQQVEALLAAQRSESHAELEAYRVAAEEAQSTLHTIETALERQLGEAQLRQPAHRGRGADVTAPEPTAPPGVDTLALDMSRIAAEAAEPATAQLLDGIMRIHDGEDVPAVLRRTVQRLFLDLTRALVPPVMTFVEQHGQREVPAESSTMTAGRAAAGSAFAPDASAEGLRRAQAEAAALQEEVNALRRTLRSGAAQQQQQQQPSSSSPPASAIITAAGASSGLAVHHHNCLHPSQVGLVESLQDRLFAECHAALTRSRSEALALRHALEEERRQHFLTRLRLLKPPATAAAPARALAAGSHSLSASPPPRRANPRSGVLGSADSEQPHTLRAAPHVVATDVQDRDRAASADRRSISGSNSSPRMRSSSATQSPPSPSPESDEENTRAPLAAAATTKVVPPPPRMSQAALPQPHRQWSPAAASPLAFGSGSRREDTDDDELLAEGAEKDNTAYVAPPRAAAHQQRPRSPPSQTASTAAPSTTRSLETAMRVAEEVLRTTTAPTEPAAHLYFRGDASDALSRWRREDGSSTDGTGAPVAMPRRRAGECSVSFAYPNDDTLMERDAGSRRSLLQRGAASASPSIRVLSRTSTGDPMSGGGMDGSRTAACTDAEYHPSFDTSWRDSAAASATTLAGGVRGLPPRDYERRVWDKTVELLSRYAVT